MVRRMTSRIEPLVARRFPPTLKKITAAAKKNPFYGHFRSVRRLQFDPPMMKTTLAHEAHIAADGSWFQIGPAAGDLSRRPVLRRVLAALCAHHLAAPEQPITVGDLVAAGWPGERCVGDSGATRVYQTVKRLRQMGLGEALAHNGIGYWLKGAPRIVTATSAAA
jgi:hypothetical protein